MCNAPLAGKDRDVGVIAIDDPARPAELLHILIHSLPFRAVGKRGGFQLGGNGPTTDSGRK